MDIPTKTHFWPKYHLEVQKSHVLTDFHELKPSFSPLNQGIFGIETYYYMTWYSKSWFVTRISVTQHTRFLWGFLCKNTITGGYSKNLRSMQIKPFLRCQYEYTHIKDLYWLNYEYYNTSLGISSTEYVWSTKIYQKLAQI